MEDLDRDVPRCMRHPKNYNSDNHSCCSGSQSVVSASVGSESGGSDPKLGQSSNNSRCSSKSSSGSTTFHSFSSDSSISSISLGFSLPSSDSEEEVRQRVMKREAAMADKKHTPTPVPTPVSVRTPVRKPSPEDKEKEKVLVPTIVSLLFDLMSFTLILPLLPSILQHYKETDKSGLYGAFASNTQKLANFMGAPARESETVLMGGILGSLFCVLQFISAPIIGAISDVFGRRVALLGCMVGICFSHVIWLAASTFPMFILARIVGGLARANVSICTTIVADDCPPAVRPKGMAMIGIAFSIGFTVGPSVGAYFALAGDLSTPALASLLLSVLSSVIIYFFVDETLALEDRKSPTELTDAFLFIWPPYLFDFKAVSVGPKLRKLGYVYFIYIFFYSGLEFTLTFLTHTKFGYTPSDQGKMFTCVGITMAILQGGVTRRLTPAMETSAAMLGMIITIPAFIIIGFAQDSVQLAFGLLCYSIGSATVGPCLTSILASKVSRANEKGVALGIFRSLGALARSFGPLFASSLFWGLGPTTAYVTGAVFLVLPLVLLKLAESGAKQE